jgi:hypothetical protein
MRKLIIGFILAAVLVGIFFAGRYQASNEYNKELGYYQLQAATREKVMGDQIRELADNITLQEAVIGYMDKMLTCYENPIRPPASRIKFSEIGYDNDLISFYISDVFVTSVAGTGSMLPMLDKGVIILIKATDDVRVGEVAIYNIGEGSIIHRIVGEDGDNWIFKGDNNTYTETIPKSAVTGRLVAVIY